MTMTRTKNNGNGNRLSGDEKLQRGTELLSTVRNSVGSMDVNRETYSHLKSFCNWFEGTARDTGVKPKDVQKFESTKNGRIKAIVAKRVKSTNKLPKREKTNSNSN